METEEKKPNTHKCEVVEVNLERHPNADRLSIARVYGFTCVTETTQWKPGMLAAYVQPDSLVDIKRPEFSFLAPQAKADDKVRIKAKKLRGVLSFGLLVPAPEGSKVGDDVSDQLGIEHYEPPVRGASGRPGQGLFASGEVAKAPNVYCVKYDLDSGRRYAAQVFKEGEPCTVTEKTHGCNFRAVFHDGKMYCGSRTEWKKEYPDYSHVSMDLLEPKVGKERAEQIIEKLQSQKKIKNLWWRVLDSTPSIRKFCEANPGMILYGEAYGSVQQLNYGIKSGEVAFAAFDIMNEGKWLNFKEAYDLAKKFEVPWVPILAEMPYNFDKVCELAEGKTTYPNASHVREGCVVRPLEERHDDRLGRACLKWVGCGYLEKDKGEPVELVDATGMF